MPVVAIKNLDCLALGLPALLQAMSRLAEFSASEVSALVSAFGSEIVRRSLFDDHIFKE